MHDRRTVLKGIATGALGLTATGLASAGGQARYLASVGASGARDRIEEAGFAVEASLADGGVLVVSGAEGRQSDLAAVSGVNHAARDVQFGLEGPWRTEPLADAHADEPAFFDLQWDKQVTEARRAHETATGDGSTVAIIDTGTDHDHPDLPNVDASAGRLFREGQVRRGTGEVEFPENPLEPASAGTTTLTRNVADDLEGHGTHVGGITAASGDVGVVGTAPDARIVPLRVFWWTEIDGSAALSTTLADILLAIDHAGNIGADAANMSIGTPPLPPQTNQGGLRAMYRQVVSSASSQGTVVIASAGNSSANLQQGGFFTTPNSVAGVMSVSATGPNDELVFYSNFGTNEIDVGAPGGGFETLEKTLSEDTAFPFPTNLVFNTMAPDSPSGQQLDGAAYAFLAGTSMAAPQVTGTAALVREVAPDAPPRQVQAAIEAGADLVTGKSNSELGAGRLNAADALDAPQVR